MSEADEDIYDHPMRALLIVEGSGDSIDYERGMKRQLYAEAGVPEY